MQNLSNEVLALLQRHRSIRQFTDQVVPKEMLEQIIYSAQMASNSSYVQAYSIIGVTDPEKKAKLKELSGNQAYVENCGHFFVFCADLQRLKQVTAKEGVDIAANLEYTEMFMVATIDAALAAQNAAIAAESLGLGIVYIGGLRNNLPEVSALLNCPELVYPVFGMAIGFPAQDPMLRPRLPQTAVYFENEYPSFEQIEEQLVHYDQQVRDYYITRSSGKVDSTWSSTMVKTLEQPRRTYMKAFLESKGFMLK